MSAATGMYSGPCHRACLRHPVYRWTLSPEPPVDTPRHRLPRVRDLASRTRFCPPGLRHALREQPLPLVVLRAPSTYHPSTRRSCIVSTPETNLGSVPRLASSAPWAPSLPASSRCLRPRGPSPYPPGVARRRSSTCQRLRSRSARRALRPTRSTESEPVRAGARPMRSDAPRCDRSVQTRVLCLSCSEPPSLSLSL